MKRGIISKLSLLLACLLVFSFASVPVFASTPKILTIDNTGGDDNPFIRFFINKKICGTGGPFTVSMDLKVENFRRFAGKDNYSAFVHLMHQDTDHKMASKFSVQKNIDWTNVKFNINNINYTIIDGAIREYCLIDVGIIYAKAILYVRNFKITNAAGKVVYSIDTDPDLDGLKDLRDIGEKNPEPILLNASFGQSGSAKYPILSDTNTTTATTKGVVYEEDVTTTKKQTDTTKKADSTTATTQKTQEQTTQTVETTIEDTTEDNAQTTYPTEQTVTTTGEAKTVVVRKIAWGRIILLIAGILVVLAAGVTGFVLYKKRKA